MLEQLPEGARVLIVRLRSLGDCVLTTPAIQLLHEHRPDLRIAVMAEEPFATVYRGNPAVRAVLPPSRRAAFLHRPRLTINLHGGTRSIGITAASLARWRAGFAHLRGQWVYNLPVPRAQQILGEERPVHTAEHVASVMFWLGVPRTEIPRARLFAAAAVPREPAFAVLHPFASHPEKTWPADRFAAVAQWLAARGVAPVFIGGPQDDLRPFAAWRTLAAAPLEEIKNHLAGASLFIGNDSGPAHMAAAFGVPSAIVFGSSDVNAWRPWRTPAQVLEGGAHAANITVEAMLAAVEQLTSQRVAR